MAKILPIRRKTRSNQSINQSFFSLKNWHWSLNLRKRIIELPYCTSSFLVTRSFNQTKISLPILFSKFFLLSLGLFHSNLKCVMDLYYRKPQPSCFTISYLHVKSIASNSLKWLFCGIHWQGCCDTPYPKPRFLWITDGMMEKVGGGGVGHGLWFGNRVSVDCRKRNYCETPDSSDTLSLLVDFYILGFWLGWLFSL